MFLDAAGVFKCKQNHRKEKHSVACSGRLPDFQASRDRITLLDPVLSHTTSKAGAKAKHSVIQDYSLIQQSSVAADVGCSSAVDWGHHHPLFPLPATIQFCG